PHVAAAVHPPRAALAPGEAPFSQGGDPTAWFAGHPSHHIGAMTVLSLSDPAETAGRFESLRAFPMNGFAADALPAWDEMELLLARLSQIGSATAFELSRALPPDRQGLAARGLGWLAKMGLITLSSDENGRVESTFAVAVSDGAETLAVPDGGSETQRLTAEAAAAQQLGDVNQAAALLRDILAASPYHAEANLRLGEILAGSGDLDGAIPCFQQAVAAAPGWTAAICALGRALMLQGETDAAIAAFRRAVGADPRAFEPLFLLGSALRRSGGVFESVQTLRNAVAMFPDRPELYYQFGLSLKAQGRRAEAAEALRRGLDLAPNDMFLKAAADSLKLALAGPKAHGAPRSRQGGRIALFFSRPQHYAPLRGLFKRLGEKHWPLLSGDWREIADFSPDMVMSCEPFPREIRRLVPGAASVFLQTSFMSARKQSEAVAGADIAVAIGPEDRDRFAKAGLPDERIWTVGAPALDLLTYGLGGRPAFFSEKPIRTVLFAPTFHPALSAAPMLAGQAVRLLRGERKDIKVVVRPHPMTCLHQPQWLAWWRTVAETGDELAADPSADIVPLLLTADVLVTDCSNVMFQFLLTDRPIVLVDNPDRFVAGAVFDPEAPEWTMRAIGERVERADDVTGAVFRALAAPETARAARAECRQHLYGSLADGRALERLLERIDVVLG
ncbi:MAG: tetratricopeptide repeat protein, partial [Alphaproteobacteria bacterium]|nr:tetratricopeptide repeat protein [Alphaproteobacteria bacterium]